VRLATVPTKAMRFMTVPAVLQLAPALRSKTVTTAVAELFAPSSPTIGEGAGPRELRAGASRTGLVELPIPSETDR